MSVSRWTAASFSLASLASLASAAHADVVDPSLETPVGPADARPVANDHGFTPGMARSTAPGAGIATSTVTYNGVSEDTALDFRGELRVWGPFRLVLQVTNVTDKARPGIGAAAQFLDETRHGVSGSAYFTYKAEGFTEAEGELEALVALGKQLGPVHGTFNVAYGQDPEGNERDGELALGLHVEPTPGLFTGVIGRYRDALGSDGDKGTGVLRDVLGAATATYAIGRFGVTASAGVEGLELLDQGSMKAGVAGALAVGAVF